MSEAFGLLLDLALRATLLIAVAAVALVLLRRGSAVHRHLVLLGALAGLLLLPLLSRMPLWELPLLPPERVFPAEELPPASDLVAPLGSLPLLPERAPAPAPDLPWPFLVWGAPALALLLRWVWRLAMLQLYTGRCRPLWRLELLELVDALAWRLGIRTIVRCLECEAGAGAPMTWGWRRPVVALPPGGETWPPARLRAVLLHELAHVARRDWLWQQVAAVACALYWFHPGVWWVAARLRAESEAACDDRVLEAGMPAPDYARSLLEVVQTMHGKQTVPAVSMARGSCLERRILAILGNRRRGLITPGAALAAAALTAAVVLPLAATRVTARTADFEPAGYPAPAAAPADIAPPEDAPEVRVRPAEPKAPPAFEAPPPPLTDREKRLQELERKARALGPRSDQPRAGFRRDESPDRARIEALVREKIARAREELERARIELERTGPERERALEKLKGLREGELRQQLEGARKEIERHLGDPNVRIEIERRFSDPEIRQQLDAARAQLERALADRDVRKHLDTARDRIRLFNSDEVRKELDLAREQLERALAQRDPNLKLKLKERELDLDRKLKEKDLDGKLRGQELDRLRKLESGKLKERAEQYERSLRRQSEAGETQRLKEQVAAMRAQLEALQRQIERLERSSGKSEDSR